MNERRIEHVLAFEALDSRGTPTVACVVTLGGGAQACATVPAGASTGRHEAHERRDGGERYAGRGVRAAVAAVNGEIAAKLRGHDAAESAVVDAALRDLDGTPALSRLGANAVLAASLATALAAAEAARVPLWRMLAPGAAPLLPRPMVNVLSGGAHAGRAVDVQDVLVIPLAAATFAEAIEHAALVRAGAAAELRERGYATALVADEGGLAAPLASNEEALEIGTRGIERAGVAAALALDVAATQLLDGDGYRLAREDRRLDGAGLAREVAGWARRYPLVSIEDPLGEDDWEAWRARDRAARRRRAAARRRPLRDLARAARARHRRGRRQCRARQAESGRHAVGRARRAGARAARGLCDRRLGALGRQRGRLARRPRRRLAQRPDQGRLDAALGAHREVEPAAAHRGRVRRTRSWRRGAWRSPVPLRSETCATSPPAAARPRSASATRCWPASRATAASTCPSAGRSCRRGGPASPTRRWPRASSGHSRATSSSPSCSSACAPRPMPASAIRRSARSPSSTRASGCSSSSTARRWRSRISRCSSSAGSSTTC